jgi:hypothetical protein
MQGMESLHVKVDIVNTQSMCQLMSRRTCTHIHTYTSNMCSTARYSCFCGTRNGTVGFLA